ncbi:MAG: M3 family metallopeptidase, partial [Sulfuricellaceae bacterium]|nr:M3 family metallopeptidase [Sulfuricellaceae bacterium]
MNPLLDYSAFPRFSEIRPEHVTPAVDQLLAENRALIKAIEADPSAPSWQGFVEVLEEANERISRAWGPVSHLNSVMNSPELREAYNANLPKLTQYYAELSQNLYLFGKYKQLRASPEFDAMSTSRRKIVENELRDFRLGGAELPDAQKARFLVIQEELSGLSAKYEENLLDATNAFAVYVTHAAELSGIPDDALEAARGEAEKDGKPGWKFTLRMPSYLPVMQYADNRALREQMYRAYSTRASELSPASPSEDGAKPDWDNTPLIGSILKLRREAAQMLGFANYAEESLAAKMAETPQQVLDFLNRLAVRAKPYAENDIAELRRFAQDSLGMDAMEPWDIAYVSEKLRVARYAFSDNEVKQYFPENVVLPGMFKLVETLYGLNIEVATAPVWHPDVKFFRVAEQGGDTVGYFYLDLYARENKRGGAWMDDAIGRCRKGDKIQAPAAYLTCNFSAPLNGKPALFTHDEVITLFHEFGHGLHHLLTRIEDLGVSGINGVEWDAVELPSQFMENFCWEW